MSEPDENKEVEEMEEYRKIFEANETQEPTHQVILGMASDIEDAIQHFQLDRIAKALERIADVLERWHGSSMG